MSNPGPCPVFPGDTVGHPNWREGLTRTVKAVFLECEVPPYTPHWLAVYTVPSDIGDPYFVNSADELIVVRRAEVRG